MATSPLAPQTTPQVYGITPEGFNLKRLYDIQQDTYAALSTVRDPASGEFLNLDPASDDPLVQIVNTAIASIAESWELAQVAYNSRDPLKATGAALDEIGQELGLTRRLGTKSVVQLFCTGTAGFIVPIGQQVTDALNSVVWTATAAIVFNGEGQATVPASPALRGPIVAFAGTLTAILTPKTGWQTVINTQDAVEGVPDESDTDYRRRILLSSMVPSSGPIDSLYSAVISLPGVTYCRAYQNRALEVDARGLKPKSIGMVVVGGDKLEIGKQIYLRSAAGLDYTGNTIVTVEDSQGIDHAIRFFRPEVKPVWVKIVTRIVDAQLWPADGVDQIKEAILLYAQGGAPALEVNVGFTPYGFTPGSTVVCSMLYTPVNSVPGHAVSTLETSVDGTTWATADITTLWAELPEFDSGRIAVEVL